LELRDEIRKHEHFYYVLDAPKISRCRVRTCLVASVMALEKEHPNSSRLIRPTQRVGGRPPKDFVKVPHSRPMLSLDNALHRRGAAHWSARARTQRAQRNIAYGERTPKL